MNGMDLYRAVGQIDDDLILAANQPPVKNVTKTRLPIRFLAAAACLILAVCGICAHVFRTSVIWNEGPVETLGGFSVPSAFCPMQNAETTIRCFCRSLWETICIAPLLKCI